MNPVKLQENVIVSSDIFLEKSSVGQGVPPHKLPDCQVVSCRGEDFLPHREYLACKWRKIGFV